jgi:hypothetical protein
MQTRPIDVLIDAIVFDLAGVARYSGVLHASEDEEWRAAVASADGQSLQPVMPV